MRPDVAVIRRRANTHLGRALAYLQSGQMPQAKAAAAQLIAELVAAGLIDTREGVKHEGDN